MKAIDQRWPLGYQTAFNLNLDDIHPESSMDGTDCGGRMDDGQFKFLNQLIAKHPNLKITLFVTPNWTYRPYYTGIKRYLHRYLKLKPRAMWKGEPFKLDDPRNAIWCKWLTEKVESGNFEVAIHGLHHFQPRYPPQEEFANATFSESILKLEEAEQILSRAQIPYVKGFRPPGFAASEGLIEALVATGFMFIAGSADYKNSIRSDSISARWGIQRVPLLYPAAYGNQTILNIVGNWDIGRSSYDSARKIVELGGLLSCYGHILHSYHGETVGNGLSEAVYKRIDTLLTLLEREYPKKVWFATLREITERWLSKET